MNLILFSVTTFAVLDYFYRFMRFVSTDLAKIAKFLCFYSKSGPGRGQLHAGNVKTAGNSIWDHRSVFNQSFYQGAGMH